MTRPAKRQVLLILLMVVVGVLVLRQYLPMFHLPTDARLQQKLRELKSVQGDLGVARKQYDDRMEMLRQTRELTAPFWMPEPGGRLDQEINSEFSRLTRMAQLSATQKVDVARDRANSSLIEVTVTLEFKGVSMRELSGFFKQVRGSRHVRQLRWEYARISPDNPRTPRNVNCTIRFKILSLNDDARAFLEARNTAREEVKAAAAPEKSRGRSTTSRRE